jgi:hypothetical protein
LPIITIARLRPSVVLLRGAIAATVADDFDGDDGGKIIHASAGLARSFPGASDAAF